MTRESILAKVQKLKAMADSAADIGNEAEALAFATKMHKLMRAHRLSMSEVELLAEDDADVMGYTTLRGEEKRRSVWQEDLALEVATAHDCRLMVPGRNTRNSITFAGHESDREMCAFVYVRLRDFAYREGKRGWRRAIKESRKLYGHPRAASGYMRSFLLGFTAVVSIRYREEREREMSGPETGVALVLRNRMDQVEKFLGDVKSADVAHDQSAHNLNGRRQGEEAGTGVNLRADRRIGDATMKGRIGE